jgi:RNA polymerase sigma factor for flagellar operon FliA
MIDIEEAVIWNRRAGSDPDVARNALFDRYSSFARAIARRQHSSRTKGDLEFADIYQMACMGLLEAIERFDPGRGVPFKAFASHRILGSIANGVARATELRGQQSAQARMRRERVRSLRSEDPSSISASDAMASLAEIAVGLALGFMLEDTGLYSPDERTAAGQNRMTGYESATWRELTGRLSAELAALPYREKLILERHYNDGLTFDALAALLGVTKGRISQLHRGALATLRKRLARGGHFTLER